MARQSLPDAEGPDPGRITSQQDFGRELTLARQQAGLTIREVAKASGIPASTVGDYFAARHLPPARQPELLPSILAACQISDAERVARWLDALNRVRRAPGRPPASGPAPYRGLASFQPEDAAWFFGREELALHLVRLATVPSAPGLPLAVVGPSESGKSSLLRAGLIPRLRAGTHARPGGRAVVLMTPGPAPLESLAGHLAPLAWPGAEGPLRTGLLAQGLREDPERYARLAGRGDEPPAVIVDQFEEIFTAGAGEDGRREFVAALSALSEHTLVVLGLRADFYGHALGYPGLARALQERQIVVGPMSADQLRRAILEPAHKAGREIEDGLVEVLLADMRPPGVAGPGGHEAGALPLLSHALLTTWEHSSGGRLTVAGYQASGGIRDAIARTAEQACATLDTGEQEVARRLFLRLVHVGDDGREARARLPLRDLPGDASAAPAVLERFVRQRLVTKDQDAAEITHEALLGAWPRLRAWIDADREDIRIRRFIEMAAQTWAQAHREAAALLRGGQLALARDWAASAASRAALTQLGRDFVDAGIAEERAQQAAERRRTRRLRQLVAILTVLVLLTVGLAVYAFHQRQTATTAKDQAESRTVAIESGQIRPEDPPLAAQLSLAAYRIAPTVGALASLLESSGGPAAARMFDSDRDVQAVALSPGRRLLAVAAADGTLRLWNVSRAGHPAPLGTVAELGPGDPLYAATFSPGGKVLAGGGSDGQVRLWDAATGTPLAVIPHPQPVTSLAFGGPGLLFTGDADGYARAWHLPVPSLLTGSPLNSIAFGPAGGTLAAAGAGLQVWNLATRAMTAGAAIPGAVAGENINAVAVSPDGNLIATGYSTGRLQLWRRGAGLAPLGRPRVASRLPAGFTNQVEFVAFRPDGKVLASAGDDGSVWLWNLAHPAHPALIAALTGPSGPVYSVAFAPGGRTLAAADSAGRVWLWDTGASAAARGVCAMAGQPLTPAEWHAYVPGLPYAPPCR